MRITLVVALLAATPMTADAGKRVNGKDLNGKDLNGKDLNGKDLNGKDLNGAALTGFNVSQTMAYGYVNGTFKSGSNMVGARINTVDANNNIMGTLKIESATQTDIWSYTVSSEYFTLGCAHLGYEEGIRLDPQCSNVEGAVIARDSYCGNTRWDSICVREFWEEYDKVNGDWWYYWHTHKETSACGQEGDTDGYWYSWRAPRKGIFLAGRWDQRQGVQGAMGKLTDGRTFACLPDSKRLGGGAIAKCVSDGYKPWASSSLNIAHQACVRLYRADVCGDGTSWTANGVPIDLFDGFGVQTTATASDSAYYDDALWTSKGVKSSFNESNRFLYSRNDQGQTYQDYYKTHTYCPSPYIIWESSTLPNCASTESDCVKTRYCPYGGC